MRTTTTSRARAGAAALVVAIAASGAIPVSGALDGTSASPAANADAGSIATIRSGPISAQLNATGKLEYAALPDGSPYTVVNHASGALTALPSPGQVRRQGQVLYRVADKPVVLLDGSTPAYRTLSEGDTGPDVRQLNTDLIALGYATRQQLDPTSDHFSSETAYALEKLQRKLGMEATGSLALGQAVFLPSPLRITNVIATLGTGQATSGRTQPHAQFVSLTKTSTTTPATTPTSTTTSTTTTTSPTTTTPATIPPSGSHSPHKPKPCSPQRRQQRHKTGSCKLKTRKHSGHGKPTGSSGKPSGNHGKSTKPTPRQKPGAGSRAPAPAHNAGNGRPGGGSARPRGASGNPGGGSGSPGASAAPPAQPIMLASSTRQDVVVRLDATEQPTVKAGDRALITLPDGRTTPGVVTRIGRVADSSGAGGSGSGSSTVTIPVHIKLKHPQAAPRLDQAPVKVQITTATLQHALAVPVTALVALTDGGYAVKTIEASAAPRLVPVTVGLLDDSGGLVQITSKKLAAGQKLLVPGPSPTTSRASLAPARLRALASAPPLRI